MSVLMYVSYIPQIYGNLHGEKGNPTQPLVAMINCIFWTIHGLYGDDGETRDKSIIFANVPGIIFGFFCFYYSIIVSDELESIPILYIKKSGGNFPRLKN